MQDRRTQYQGVCFTVTVDDFGVAARSLLENVADYIGNDRLLYLAVFADDQAQTVDVAITLRDQTWAEQERAIDKMVEIRGMFLDDLSISYEFLGENEKAVGTKSCEVHELLLA